MAAYVKQQDQVVLILSKAEALALKDRLDRTQEGWDVVVELFPSNNSTAAALDRAQRALAVACEPSSRSGAAIQ